MEMDDRTLQSQLTELVRNIDAMSVGDKDNIRELLDQAKARQEKMKNIISELTESLDYLRLSVKYLVFDLEATRRENRYLRKILEQMPRDRERGSEDDGA